MATASADPGTIVNISEPQSAEAETLLQMTIRRFFKHRMAVIGVIMLILVILYVIVGAFFFSEDYANETNVLFRWGAPSQERPMGSDNVGRDIIARTIWGGQISLLIGVTSMAIGITLGTVVGLVAGYFGGIADAILMRIVEALLAIPTLVLLLVLSRVLIDTAAGETIPVFGRELSISIVAVILIIGFTSWMGLSRVVRSMVLSIKEQEFISAARALGAGNVRILFQHILPNCLAPIIVAATLQVGSAIIIEAALSFLGFGVQPPDASWGNIINLASQDVEAYWWVWFFPGAFIVITVLSINFIGDGLRDALDPRSMK